MPNHLLIEGHTDSKPYATEAKGYSNWELSADRANSTRRILQQNGVKADQIKEVRGFADQQLRNKADPFDPGNRRVSVLVQYQDPSSISEAMTRGAMGTAIQADKDHQADLKERKDAAAAKASPPDKGMAAPSPAPPSAANTPAKPSPTGKK